MDAARFQRRAFLFPGQGAQSIGMAVDLVDSSPEVRRVYDRARDVVGNDFLDICRDGPEEEINSTRVSQPAIFLHSMAVLEALRASGWSAAPLCRDLGVAGAAGLSLGEYSALVFVGSLEFEDALDLVVRRGEYMQSACDVTSGTMASILGLEAARIEEVVDGLRAEDLRVGVANYNSPSQTVISGERGAVERACEMLRQAGARRVVELRVAGAYHSGLMAAATVKLEPHLRRVSIAAPRVPFYSNVTGGRVEDPEEIRLGLVRQVETSVRWEQSLRAMIAGGVQDAWEIGPSRVLKGLMKNVDRKVRVTSLGTVADLEAERQREAVS